jgi:hypothetical protein
LIVQAGIVKSGLINLGLIKSGLLQAIQQYFRRNEATTDYISHITVTVDRIVMDVSPTAGNTGLPTGSPEVVNGLFQTIDFTYSGTISELCRNGSDYYAGIMANVKYYFGGVQIHGYDIKSNSSDVPDNVGSNDATIINGTAGQWGLFNQQATGQWIGQNLSEISSTGVLGDNSDPEFAFPYSVTGGLKYRIKAVFENSFSAGTGQVGWSSSSGVPATSDFRKTSASAGESIGGDYVATSSQSNALFGRANPNASYVDISVSEILDIALPLFNSSGVIQCDGIISCHEIIPCGV